MLITPVRASLRRPDSTRSQNESFKWLLAICMGAPVGLSTVNGRRSFASVPQIQIHPDSTETLPSPSRRLLRQCRFLSQVESAWRLIRPARLRSFRSAWVRRLLASAPVKELEPIREVRGGHRIFIEVRAPRNTALSRHTAKAHLQIEWVQEPGNVSLCGMGRRGALRQPFDCKRFQRRRLHVAGFRIRETSVALLRKCRT